jgi:heme A synthase
MAAGDDGRLRVGRRRSPLRERATRSGWLLLLGIVAAAVALGFIVHFAGIPGRLTPLVIGGCLALLTAVVSPMEDGPRDE